MTFLPEAANNASTSVTGGLIARYDDVADAGTPSEHRGVVNDDLPIAAVGAAGEKDDVRRDLLYLPELGLGELERVGADNLGPSSQRGPAAGFRGVLRDQSDADYPQAAGRTAAGDGLMSFGFPDGDGLREE